MSVTVTPNYCVPKHQASTSHSLAPRGHVRPRHSPARYVTVEESDDEYYNESNHGAFVDYLSGPPRVASGSASGATAAGFNRNRDAEGGCRTPPPAKIAQMTHMDTACCHDGRHRQVRSVKVQDAAVRRPGGSTDCGRITPDAVDGGLPLVVSLPRPRVRVVTIRPQNTSRYGSGGGHDGDDDDDDDATPTLPAAARPATSMHPSSAASHSNGDDSDASSTTSVSTADSSRTSGSGVSDMSFKFCQGGGTGKIARCDSRRRSHITRADLKRSRLFALTLW